MRFLFVFIDVADVVIAAVVVVDVAAPAEAGAWEL